MAAKSSTKKPACIFVDLENQGAQFEWQKKTKAETLPFTVRFTTSPTSAMEILENDEVCTLVIFAEKATEDLEQILAAFQQNVGYLPEFQALVCEEPDPWFLARIFEYGIDRLISRSDWVCGATGFLEECSQLLADPKSPEAKTIRLSRSIRSGKEEEIDLALRDLQEVESYDYRAAYAKAVALESKNDLSGATESFRKATEMNRFARQAVVGYANTLLQGGDIDKARVVLEQLEKTNPRSPRIKAQLAIAFSDLGMKDKAAEYLKKAAAIADGENRDLAYAKVKILFNEEKFEEAVNGIGFLEDLGQQEVSFLIRMGLRLGRKNNKELATLLYRKAHRAVLEDLKYRVSLHAALAAYQSKENDLALVYLDRAQSEVGAKIDELESIRTSIMHTQKKAS